MKNGALHKNVNLVCPVNPLAFAFFATVRGRDRGKETGKNRQGVREVREWEGGRGGQQIWQEC